MEVIGHGSVHVYDKVDECPHVPTDELLWQESWVIYAFDVERQVYVYMRLSQEPNRGAGMTTAWLNVWTPETFYKHTNDSIPMESSDVGKTSISAGGGLCRYEYDGTHKWTLHDGGTHARLKFEDYHPGFGYYAEGAGFLVSSACRNHIEATGWVTGTVEVAGKTYELSGQGWRDHSWGPRDWPGILVHRFFPALFGRDFNFFCVTMVGKDGTMCKFGTIIRGNTVQAANDFEIISYISDDGVTNHGGRVNLRLDGKTQVLDFEPLAKGTVSLHQGLPCVDTMCRVTMGDRVGVGVAETNTRAQGGTATPHIYDDSPGVLKNGIFPITR